MSKAVILLLAVFTCIVLNGDLDSQLDALSDALTARGEIIDKKVCEASLTDDLLRQLKQCHVLGDLLVRVELTRMLL